MWNYVFRALASKPLPTGRAATATTRASHRHVSPLPRRARASACWCSVMMAPLAPPPPSADSLNDPRRPVCPRPAFSLPSVAKVGAQARRPPGPQAHRQDLWCASFHDQQACRIEEALLGCGQRVAVPAWRRILPGRNWSLVLLGIAFLSISCALAYVLDGYDGRSTLVGLVLYMYGDHFVRVSGDLLATSVLRDLLLFVDTKPALWHVAACFANWFVSRGAFLLRGSLRTTASGAAFVFPPVDGLLGGFLG